MTEAIFGLIGVVVGALVTGTVEWIQAERSRRIATRAARRLVAQELLACTAAIDMAASKDDTLEVAEDMRDSFTRGLVSNDAWAAHNGILAERLGDDVWESLTDAYVSITFLLGSRDHTDEDLADTVKSIHSSDKIRDGFLAV
jgi:hypothetical protein